MKKLIEAGVQIEDHKFTLTVKSPTSDGRWVVREKFAFKNETLLMKHFNELVASYCNKKQNEAISVTASGGKTIFGTYQIR